MTCTSELSAALGGERLELYRRMWVLRLLDMAMEEWRIDGPRTGRMGCVLRQVLWHKEPRSSSATPTRNSWPAKARSPVCRSG